MCVFICMYIHVCVYIIYVHKHALKYVYIHKPTHTMGQTMEEVGHKPSPTKHTYVFMYICLFFFIIYV